MMNTSLIKKLKTDWSSFAIKKWRHYFLQGNNVECPICNKKFITFLPSGNPLRLNSLCPNCYSLERTRLIWFYLNNQQGFFSEGKKVLHIAPEKSLFEKFTKQQNIIYYSIDKFTPGYAYPKRTINMDLTHLDFLDNSFDFFLCSHVLEHIPNDSLAMQELFRVLKKDGFGLILVPMDNEKERTYEDFSIINPAEREKHFGQYDHVRLYGLDIKKRLQQVGFEVTFEKGYIKNFGISEKIKFGLTDKDIIIRVSK